MIRAKSHSHTWGDIYYLWLRKGVDHSYAAYMANQWEARIKRINEWKKRTKGA